MAEVVYIEPLYVTYRAHIPVPFLTHSFPILGARYTAIGAYYAESELMETTRLYMWYPKTAKASIAVIS
jgi:hypothetical protein